MEFSRQSRKRLLDLLNSINRKEIPIPIFLTLTYPASWPKDPRRWKKHLDNFGKRLKRQYGDFPVIWRLEFQTRGAPHFHLLLFADLDRGKLIRWVTKAWYQVVESGDPKHERAGTRVEFVRSWNGVNSYAAKYLGKLESLQLPDGSPGIGRVWGVWNKSMLPRQFVTVDVTMEDAIRIRRHMARWAGLSLKSSKDLRNFSVYMPAHLTERLLRFYGYDPDKGKFEDA